MKRSIGKWTPGPWSVCRKGECSCKMVSGKDHPVATVECGKWGDEYPSIRLVGGSFDRKAEAYMDRICYGEIPEEVARANARLIAAAPELLEALKALTNTARTFRNVPKDEQEWTPIDDEALATALAAIAKAEGRD